MANLTPLKPGTEWIGGTMTVPAYVTGESDAPYRAEILLWSDRTTNASARRIHPGMRLDQGSRSGRPRGRKPDRQLKAVACRREIF
jgi:hypothetical protein